MWISICGGDTLCGYLCVVDILICGYICVEDILR